MIPAIRLVRVFPSSWQRRAAIQPAARLKTGLALTQGRTSLFFSARITALLCELQPVCVVAGRLTVGRLMLKWCLAWGGWRTLGSMPVTHTPLLPVG